MVTAKELTLAWEREERETRFGAESEREREEEEFGELEILFPEVSLQRPSCEKKCRGHRGLVDGAPQREEV